MKLIINTDGGARGNPGPAAIGVVIKDESGKLIDSFGKYLGEQTNNFAEYSGVIFALEKAIELKANEIKFNLDSELVVKQLKGEYKVKNAELAKLYLKIHNLSQNLKKIEYKHVYREANQEADALVNQILDKQ